MGHRLGARCAWASLTVAVLAGPAAMPAQLPANFSAPATDEAELSPDGADGEPEATLTPTPGVTVDDGTLHHGKLDRRYIVLRPTTAGTTRAPLFVLLHYHHGTPKAMATLTKATRLVTKYGAWVVLPRAFRRSWNFNPSAARRVDDSGFLAQLIDEMLAADPIDPQRVYMAGFSQGGFMTMRFLCEHSERIAAAGWSSAELVDAERDVCSPPNATPVIAFHGTADGRVRYRGQVGVASAPDTAAYFAGLNGCLSPPDRTALPNTAADHTTVVLDTYDSCSSAKPVRFYTINGGGHTWPGNDYQGPVFGRTTQDIDATLLLYSFAMKFTR